jgi:hypothetical protein
LVHVEPEVGVGVELYCVEVAEDVELGGEAAADVPEGRGEGAAGLALGPIAPEEADQLIAGLGLVAMEDEVGQEGLGFEGGRFGQGLMVIADV